GQVGGATLTRYAGCPMVMRRRRGSDRAGSAMAVLLLRRGYAVQLKVPFRNSDHISRQNWNRCRYGIVAHAGLAAPLELNCIAARSICGAAGDGEGGEDIEPALVRKFAWFRDLTHHVKGP